MNEVIIETERLFIKQWTLDDIEGLFNVMSDSKVHIYTGDNPWTMERCKSYIEFNINRKVKSLEDFHGAVVLKESNEIIGLTGLNPYLTKEPEIEWQLGARFWGKGYATEVGKAIIEAAFKNTDITKIYGMVNPDNIGSKRVMNKIGMTFLGFREFRGEETMFYEYGGVLWKK